jgi:hypothetical protein
MTSDSNSPNQWESIDWNKRNTTTTTTVRVVAYQQHFQTGVGGVGSLVKDLYCCCCCWIDTVRQEGGRRVGIQDVIDTRTWSSPQHTHRHTDGVTFSSWAGPQQNKDTHKSFLDFTQEQETTPTAPYIRPSSSILLERDIFCLERVSLLLRRKNIILFYLFLPSW